jgi:hypothetical protein
MIDMVLLEKHIVVDPVVWEVLLYGLIILACLLLIFFIRIYIAVKMAKKRNRSTLAWGLFSFFISPVWAWIILAILGEEKQNPAPKDEEVDIRDVDIIRREGEEK